MTSTEFNIGLTGQKNSSRVLKPPGGGHSDIFGDVETKVNNPRPKYDQQNSSNLNFCMNTTDPNVLVEQVKHDLEEKKSKDSTTINNEQSSRSSTTTSNNQEDNSQTSNKNAGRVPPGGFSSGLW